MNTNKTDKQIETLTISRKRWLTAKDIDEGKRLYSWLYRSEDRKMCCLGFLGRACGAKVSQLRNIGEPDRVPSVNWPKGMLVPREYYPNKTYNAGFVYDMMRVNDNPKLTARQREKEIKRLFKTYLNITVKFVP